MATPGPAPGPVPEDQSLLPQPLPGTDLIVDRPATWRVGGTSGYGVLVSLIGRGEGYPNFSVMTDPQVAEHDNGRRSRQEREVEGLFRQLLVGQSDVEIHEEGWREVNGLRLHASLTSWTTVAGRLRARRAIFVHHGRPYIFTWVELDALYDQIAEMIERCVASVRVERAEARGGVVG